MRDGSGASVAVPPLCAACLLTTLGRAASRQAHQPPHLSAVPSTTRRPLANSSLTTSACCVCAAIDVAQSDKSGQETPARASPCGRAERRAPRLLTAPSLPRNLRTPCTTRPSSRPPTCRRTNGAHLLRPPHTSNRCRRRSLPFCTPPSPTPLSPMIPPSRTPHDPERAARVTGAVIRGRHRQSTRLPRRPCPSVHPTLPRASPRKPRTLSPTDSARCMKQASLRTSALALSSSHRRWSAHMHRVR